ncbi:HEAT repeat domain-containing protein [Methylovirgula sp. 4M-Z18]|uniref:HEAT repeat domain-containing protein n=1 Tax=Methylovirgula sp. 4M-Z18 TaxID=2293567 RepID=UPI00131400AD|nr:HEAT repeat domain-containing protein [Methylovirgula sp. 4M-Z18]
MNRAPPSWMVSGFEAAIADPASVEATLQSPELTGLARFVPSEHVAPLIDKMLALLSDERPLIPERASVVLTEIATGERAGPVVDKLLPLLAGPHINQKIAAADALGGLAIGDRANSVTDKLIPLLASPLTFTKLRTAAVRNLSRLANGPRAGEVVEQFLRILDTSHDIEEKEAVVQGLGTLATGEQAGRVIERLLPLLLDSDPGVQNAAGQALGRLATGKQAEPVLNNVLPLLDFSSTNVQAAAAVAVGQIATQQNADRVIDRLLPLAGASEPWVSRQAEKAIIDIATRNPDISAIDKLLEALQRPGTAERVGAERILGQLATGERADSVVDKVLPLLDASDPLVRATSIQVLGQLATGERADKVVDRLIPLLDGPELFLRTPVVQALGRLATGERARRVFDKLDKLMLRNDLSDARPEMVRAMGELAPTERVGLLVDGFLPLLDDIDTFTRDAAVQALGKLATGEQEGPVLDKLMPLLGYSFDEASNVRLAIANLGPGGIGTAVTAVRLIDGRDDEAVGRLRAAAHVVTGSDAKNEGSELLLAWVGRPAALPVGSVEDNPLQAHKVLKLLTENWVALSKETGARVEVENSAMTVIQAACQSRRQMRNPADFSRAMVGWFRDLPTKGPFRQCWTPEQRATVEQLLTHLKEVHSPHATALEEELKGEDQAPIGLWATRSFGLWTLFWLAFLIAYPWSRTIQAIFFWNPRVRAMMSLWFIPLLLLIFPPLKRRLLAPFRDDLVAQARLGDLSKLGYFADGRGRFGGGEPLAIAPMLTKLRGVVVLQADSGLGKTSLLRTMAAQTSRPVAFLHARDCADGVDAAICHIIQNVQETGFIRGLVHTRSLFVIVDGLNEVSADTREKIGAFAREMSKGDVIVATQPIEWRPPPNARTLELLPLNRAEATDFIESRPVGSDSNQPCHGQDFKVAAQAFVSRALDNAPSQIEREASMLILSNPFDLTFAAELVARGIKPSATMLIDEAFRLATQNYQEVAKIPFPLRAFGRHAVKMRSEDRNWLNPDEFVAEAPFLLAQRLLVSRALQSAQGIENRLLFRHDRVWDFFIAAAFADDPDFWTQYAGDARFHGAFLRIAESWDPEHAKKVRDQLNLAAANSGDHSTSDEFIKRLEKRLRAKKRNTARDDL